MPAGPRGGAVRVCQQVGQREEQRAHPHHPDTPACTGGPLKLQAQFYRGLNEIIKWQLSC